MTQPAEKRAEPTPGPWKWDAGDIGQDYPAPYCDVFVDGGNLIIAQVNDRFSREIGHANARLIAAAPDTAAERDRLEAANAELLAALGSSISILETLRNERLPKRPESRLAKFHDDRDRIAQAVLENARAALAKQEITP